MPAAFRAAIHYTLVGVKNTHCFLDYIVVSRGSKNDHLYIVGRCLKKLDEGNLRINLTMCLPEPNRMPRL